MDKYQLQEKISQTEQLVEADSFASLCLWERWSKDSNQPRQPRDEDWPRFTWKQHNVGTTLEIGQLDGRPVMLTLFWNTIEGALVCFWNSGSQVTDYKMIEEFLEKKFPGIPNRDAMNFHNVVGDIQERDPKKKTAEFPEAQRILGREAVELFREKGILTTRTFEMALLAKDKGEDGAAEVFAAVEEVQHQCDRFRDLVWLPWLKDYYKAASTTGHEAHAAALNMMVYGLAGRVMISLKFGTDNDDESRNSVETDYFVSLLGYDGEGDGMYVRGAYGKASVLAAMIDTAILNGDAFQVDIHPNDDVRLAI